ncbi:MAG: alpha/beta fold hydrolase [Dehalococcoidia bacterium]
MTSARIVLTAQDGVILRGSRAGAEDDWVVLIHDFGKDVRVWRAAHRFLQRRKFTRLAVNLRGHGSSEGQWDARLAARDVEAALNYARGQEARTVFVLAEGQGATAALAAADCQPPDGLVLLSPGPLLGRDAKELRGNGVSKLFIVGSRQQAAHEATMALRRWSIGWAATVYLPTEEQGAALLSGAYRSQALDQIAGFLHEQRHLAGNEVDGGATGGPTLSRQRRALQAQMLKRLLRR